MIPFDQLPKITQLAILQKELHGVSWLDTLKDVIKAVYHGQK